MEQSHRFHFVIPVWGAHYHDTLHEFLLPSLLAPGNLPDWKYKANTVLHLLGDLQEQTQLLTHPIMAEIAKHCQIKFSGFDFDSLKDWLLERTEYQRYTLGHIFLNTGIHYAQIQGAHVLPWMADMLIAEGFFQFLETKFNQGTVLLMSPSPRVDLKAFTHAIQPYRKKDLIAISPWDLAQATVDTFHPQERACFANAREFTNAPMRFYLPQADKLIAHCFHLHPLFMRFPKPLPYDAFSTIDLDFISQYDDQRDSIHLASNHQTAAASLAHPENDQWIHKSGPRYATPQAAIQAFAERWTTPLHRWFFKQAIAFPLPS